MLHACERVAGDRDRSDNGVDDSVQVRRKCAGRHAQKENGSTGGNFEQARQTREKVRKKLQVGGAMRRETKRQRQRERTRKQRTNEQRDKNSS